MTYRLANEDQELWWDSDSSRLNSRLRHDFSTPLASVEVAAVRCLVGDGSSVLTLLLRSRAMHMLLDYLSGT